jgi:hypothetical protein
MATRRAIHSIKKFLESPFARKQPNLIQKGNKAAAAEVAVKTAEATAAVDLEEAKRLAVEFEALGGGTLAMALAPLREFWLARERLHVSEARSINRADILAAAAAGAAAKDAAEALGARAALAPELPKEHGGGAGGMAADAEEIPGRPLFSVGAREELKTRGGSFSGEGANGAVQAVRSTPIKVLRSL